MPNRLPVPSAFLLLLALGACASIQSLDSSVQSASTSLESLSSPFESSSTMTASDVDDRTRRVYSRDVLAFTIEYLRQPDDDGEFARGLGRIAREHGINDWQAEPATFAAIDAARDRPEVEPSARARLQRELSAYASGS